VLFGAINLRTAHRVVLIRPRAGAADAQTLLRELRRRYRAAGTIWLLADRASAHTAARTQMLAAALGIRFLWWLLLGSGVVGVGPGSVPAGPL
jgi:hypothetical protein